MWSLDSISSALPQHTKLPHTPQQCPPPDKPRALGMLSQDALASKQTEICERRNGSVQTGLHPLSLKRQQAHSRHPVSTVRAI